MYKILVVDDDRTFLKMISTLLKRSGYDVRVAMDGHEGLEAIKKEKPDLLVLDVMMQGMSGYEVSHHIKFEALLEDLPIILFTSEPPALDLWLSYVLGIEYLHKSCSLGVLLDRISKILQAKESKIEVNRELKEDSFKEFFEHDQNVSEGIKKIIEFRVRSAVRRNDDKNKYRHE